MDDRLESCPGNRRTSAFLCAALSRVDSGFTTDRSLFKEVCKISTKTFDLQKPKDLEIKYSEVAVVVQAVSCYSSLHFVQQLVIRTCHIQVPFR